MKKKGKKSHLHSRANGVHWLMASGTPELLAGPNGFSCSLAAISSGITGSGTGLGGQKKKERRKKEAAEEERS